MAISDLFSAAGRRGHGGQATAAASSASSATGIAAGGSVMAGGVHAHGGGTAQGGVGNQNADVAGGVPGASHYQQQQQGQGVAAAGGGPVEVWGGGALSRTLSEGATQVVSELGQMGYREGEALTKIDSLGYQLASLLDNHNDDDHRIGLGDISMYGEHSGDLTPFAYSSPSAMGGNGSPEAEMVVGTGEGGSGVGAAGGFRGGAAAATAAAINGAGADVVEPLEINDPAASHIDIGTGVDISSPLSTEAVDVGGEESGQAIVHTRDTANTGVEMVNGNGSIIIDGTVGTAKTDDRERVTEIDKTPKNR